MLVTNASITQIEVPNTLDDYDAPPGDTVKWSGTADCYLEQKTRRIANGQGGMNYVREWTVYLDLATPPVTVDVGDLITITQAAADSTNPIWTVPVMSTESRQQNGMPPDVQSRAILVDPSGPGT